MKKPVRKSLVAALLGLSFAVCRKTDSPLASSTLPTVAIPGVPCGVERWSVKTLSDADALRVDFTPVPTTVSALNDLPVRCSGLPSSRFVAEEFRVYEVDARVSLVRREDDRDYHVVLMDDSGATIVVEIADPTCSGAASSPFTTTLSKTRSDFDALGSSSLPGRRVRVRGVGFYDFNHGQTGRSRSCFELHPVVSVILL